MSFDWGELWEFPFHAAVWGTVGQWASGVGSTGALLLGLSILLRDRRARERDQASKISCWYENGMVDNERCLKVMVRNNSDSDIYQVLYQLIIPATKTKLSVDYREYQGWVAKRMAPKEEASVVISPYDHEMFYVGGVAFIDAMGKFWYRDKHTHKIGKYKESFAARTVRAKRRKRQLKTGRVV